MSHVAQVHALAGLVLFLVAALVAQHDRPGQPYPTGRGWLEPTWFRGVPDRPLSDWLPDPAWTAEVHPWIASTAGQSRPGDIVGHGRTVDAMWTDLAAWGERVAAPPPRVLPDWWRYSTDEVRALVEAG